MSAPDPPLARPGQRGLVLRLLILHSFVVPALFTGVSPVAVLAFAITYVSRIFGVTAGYHRLFSHHAYQTSRPVAFALAWLGAASGQRGPLWWAAVHRRHHRTADTVDDIHSPKHKGLLFAHVGWILDKQNLRTRVEEVHDWAKFPELRFLDRFHLLAPASLVLALFVVGEIFARSAGGTTTATATTWAWVHNTSGLQLVAWGFVLSTEAEIHVTSCVNSLSHRFGTRPWKTGDDSGNIWWLAIPTLGEAWHNNHHHRPGSVRQGFDWWQVDLSYWALRMMAAVGLVWNLREPSGIPGLRTTEGFAEDQRQV